MSEGTEQTEGVRLISADLCSVLQDFLGRAQYKATIIAPFMRSDALKAVLTDVDSAVRLTVVTRWAVDEIVAGASDTGVYEVLQDRGDGRLLLHPQLHAKLFLADYDSILFGSANLTNAALGLAKTSNIEILGETQANLDSLLIVQEIVEAATEVTAEYRDAVDKAVAEAREIAPAAVQHETPNQHAREQGSGVFLPRLRTPERLYEAFTDIESLPLHQIPNALQDLLFFRGSLSDSSREAFDAALSEQFRSTEVVEAIYSYLSEPRRFGEITEWLKQFSPEASCLSHQEAQRRLQTLLRWLVYFLPETFELTTPRHTEVLSRLR